MELKTRMQRYARVLVHKGAALRQGQALCIQAPVEAAEFVEILTEEAYKAGCGEIGIIWKSDRIERMKMENETIRVFEYDMAMPSYFAEKESAYIRLDYPDFQIFEGADPEKLNEKAIADKAVRVLFQKNMELGQTIACIPNQSWADKVYPELPKEQRVEALWDAVFVCARCDSDDPIERWDQFIEETNRRKQYFEEKKYVSYHYKSGNTDLTIRPIADSMWGGGCIERQDGTCFTPNIPTEEVFTTPHKDSAEGYVASTKPLCYKGQIIENFVLYFEKGRIVKWQAEKGQELLDALIGTDEGSHYLGEMAFVDEGSPIASTGKVFYTTLFDENASCHLAIGNAYGPSDQEIRAEQGYNSSDIHVDFMIGSEDMNIKGQLPDGSWEDIFVNGHWV